MERRRLRGKHNLWVGVDVRIVILKRQREPEYATLVQTPPHEDNPVEQSQAPCGGQQIDTQRGVFQQVFVLYADLEVLQLSVDCCHGYC